MSIFEYPESPRAPWRTGDGSQDALQGYAYSPAKTSERDRLNAFRNSPALRAKFPQWNAKMAGKPVTRIASGSTSGRTSTSSRTGKDIDVIDAWGRTISVPAVSGVKRDMDGNVRIKNQTGAVRRLLNKAVTAQLNIDEATRKSEFERSLTPINERMTIENLKTGFAKSKEARRKAEMAPIIEARDRRLRLVEAKRKKDALEIRDKNEKRLQAKFDTRLTDNLSKLTAKQKNDLEKMDIKNGYDLEKQSIRYDHSEALLKDRIEASESMAEKRRLEREHKEVYNMAEDMFKVREDMTKGEIDNVEEDLKKVNDGSLPIGKEKGLLERLSFLRGSLIVLRQEMVDHISKSIDDESKEVPAPPEGFGEE